MQWKQIVNTAVYSRESTLWFSRVSIDDSLSRFNDLHSSIKPSFVWKYPSNNRELQVARFVSKLWIIPTQHSVNVCCLCDLMYSDLLEHILSTCLSLNAIRNLFLEKVTDEFPIYTSAYLLNCSETDFTLVLLGNSEGLNL